MDIALFFFFICLSCSFFSFAIQKSDSIKTMFLLKSFCIFMMFLVIEALMRNVAYIRNIGEQKFSLLGNQGNYLTFFLVVSILALCTCIFTLKNKLGERTTRNIYICSTLALISAIVIFPFVSVNFLSSMRIISVWVCIAAALYGLSQYACLYKDITESEKQQILKNIMRFCVILSAWIIIWKTI